MAKTVNIYGGSTITSKDGKIEMPAKDLIFGGNQIIESLLNENAIKIPATTHETQYDKNGEVIGRYDPVHKKIIQGLPSKDFINECDKRYKKSIEKETKMATKRAVSKQKEIEK